MGCVGSRNDFASTFAEERIMFPSNDAILLKRKKICCLLVAFTGLSFVWLLAALNILYSAKSGISYFPWLMVSSFVSSLQSVIFAHVVLVVKMESVKRKYIWLIYGLGFFWCSCMVGALLIDRSLHFFYEVWVLKIMQTYFLVYFLTISLVMLRWIKDVDGVQKRRMMQVLIVTSIGAPMFGWAANVINVIYFDGKIELMVLIGPAMLLVGIMIVLSLLKPTGTEMKCFASLLERTNQLVVILDADKRMIYANPRMTKKIGVDLPKLLGRKIEDILDIDLTEASSKMQTVLKLRQENGTVFFKMTDIRNNDNELRGIIMIGTDHGTINCLKREREKSALIVEAQNQSYLTDALTGFANFRALEVCEMEMEDISLREAALVIIDFDGLCTINHKFGHFVGDYCIIQLRDIIRSSFSGNVRLFRVCGDEFAVLFGAIGIKELDFRMKVFQAEVDRINDTSEYPFHVTCGIGRGLKGEGVLSMLMCAEKEMQFRKLFSENSSKSSLVKALENIVLIKDSYTAGHTDRLVAYVKQFAHNSEFSFSMNRLHLLAKFHDIGKMGIPDRILFNETALTVDEMKIIRDHSQIGSDLAAHIPELSEIAPLILHHHERWDGKGYPMGLCGDEIPKECRLMAIIDSFDAMTSDRCYRRAISWNSALEEISRCAGTQFDPVLAQLFVKMMRKAA